MKCLYALALIMTASPVMAQPFMYQTWTIPNPNPPPFVPPAPFGVAQPQLFQPTPPPQPQQMLIQPYRPTTGGYDNRW